MSNLLPSWLANWWITHCSSFNALKLCAYNTRMLKMSALLLLSDRETCIWHKRLVKSMHYNCGRFCHLQKYPISQWHLTWCVKILWLGKKCMEIKYRPTSHHMLYYVVSLYYNLWDRYDWQADTELPQPYSKIKPWFLRNIKQENTTISCMKVGVGWWWLTCNLSCLYQSWHAKVFPAMLPCHIGMFITVTTI